MDRIKDNLLELFQICVYAFAVFGAAMLAAYLGVLCIPERNYIPMQFIYQIICFITGIVISIVLCLSDVVLKNISVNLRIVLFFVVLYVMGIVFFQFTAPIGHRPFDAMLYFSGFSIFIANQSLFAFASWFIYSFLIDNKYDKCLKNYKKNLKC